MASDTPCGGDAFWPVVYEDGDCDYQGLPVVVDRRFASKADGCKGCTKAAVNGGKCAGGAPEVEK